MQDKAFLNRVIARRKAGRKIEIVQRGMLIRKGRVDRL